MYFRLTQPDLFIIELNIYITVTTNVHVVMPYEANAD